MTQHPIKQAIRDEIRARRAELTSDERSNAAISCANQFVKTDLFQENEKMGFYMAENGELNPHPLLVQAWEQGKSTYLPVLETNNNGHLEYYHYRHGDPLQENRFGILEPIEIPENLILASELDLVFTPLVAFDLEGNRLGMGAGYYDRTFSFLQKNKNNHTKLIGLAYGFQRVDKLICEPWDIPLDAVATENQIYYFDEE